MPPKPYRKRPVEIEAWQVNTEDYDELCEIARWSGAGVTDEDGYVLYIFTLEGVMKAGHGDYIIKGVNDEFYPCKAHVFEQTYEFVWG